MFLGAHDTETHESSLRGQYLQEEAKALLVNLWSKLSGLQSAGLHGFFSWINCSSNKRPCCKSNALSPPVYNGLCKHWTKVLVWKISLQKERSQPAGFSLWWLRDLECAFYTPH